MEKHSCAFFLYVRHRASTYEAQAKRKFFPFQSSPVAWKKTFFRRLALDTEQRFAGQMKSSKEGKKKEAEDKKYTPWYEIYRAV
jgi:hypothetical protein